MLSKSFDIKGKNTSTPKNSDYKNNQVTCLSDKAPDVNRRIYLLFIH